MACVVPPGEAWSWFADKQATIHGTPITLSVLAFNILMGIAGGIIGSWIWTKDPFWMMSGALAGIISVASGLDIYFPALAKHPSRRTGTAIELDHDSESAARHKPRKLP